jgi:hypothetical protein
VLILEEAGNQDEGMAWCLNSATGASVVVIWSKPNPTEETAKVTKDHVLDNNTVLCMKNHYCPA